MSTLHRTGAAAFSSLLLLAACDAPVSGPGGPGELAGPAFSESAPVQQRVAVNWHPQQLLTASGGTGKSGPVEAGWARLVRKENGIAYEIRANQLQRRHAYSLWLVVINNPAACAATPCSAAEILTNPGTDSQVLSGGTGVVAGSGRVMAGAAKVGPLSGWLDGRSLKDPFTAEVHLVINDHGPMIPEFMPDMITTYRAGCSDSSPFPAVFPPTALSDGAVGPNTCLLYQAAVFPAP